MSLIASIVEFATEVLYLGLTAGAESFRSMMKNQIPESPQKRALKEQGWILR